MKKKKQIVCFVSRRDDHYLATVNNDGSVFRAMCIDDKDMFKLWAEKGNEVIAEKEVEINGVDFLPVVPHSILHHIARFANELAENDSTIKKMPVPAECHHEAFVWYLEDNHPEFAKMLRKDKGYDNEAIDKQFAIAEAVFDVNHITWVEAIDFTATRYMVLNGKADNE